MSKNYLSKLLWYSGFLLILLGLLHVPVWLISGGGWEGSISWRKPILFGISTGMTLCSLGWVTDHLVRNLLDRVVGWLTSISLVIEVGLITMQQWRGVASHFNRDSAFDSRVDMAMVILICIAFAGIVYFFVRCLGKIRMESDYVVAARSGMLLLVVSCLIGFVISSFGYQKVAANLPPETVGENGVAKFPHGVAIHALQILPAIVWLLRQFKIQHAHIKVAIYCVAASFGLQIAFAVYQTASGFARFQLVTPTGFLLATLAGLLVVVPAVWFTWKQVAATPRRTE
ncbi:hypothetical protein [Mariniblastus fucicola]|uniref:Uncharacterized protein n=1 Tax=Mariniblastus fucicola TaxID=980251 RepID=A0A5B9PJK7_9BACT|nr:hypothetical protein [Mariniblastus fucicola]QEG24902.1 hypothetical protein MFFC18_48250 [Mariniblastus fucicola]